MSMCCSYCSQYAYDNCQLACYDGDCRTCTQRTLPFRSKVIKDQRMLAVLRRQLSAAESDIKRL